MRSTINAIAKKRCASELEDDHSLVRPRPGQDTLTPPDTGETNDTNGKRRRQFDHWSEQASVAKRRRKDGERQKCSAVSFEKEEYIEDWLENGQRAHRTSVSSIVKSEPDEFLPDMSRKLQAALPSPRDSFTGSTTTSRRSERSTASVHDTDYRKSLRLRNIFIEREDVPHELLRRAQRITSRSRASPEMDDDAIRELQNRSRQLQEEGEDEIVQQLAPGIIPAMNKMPDHRLASSANQWWSNAVPIPLDADVLASPLPLPKPKPDLAFGFSESAFSHKQVMTVDLLVDDQFGKSYAIPDQKLRFPFLDVEFKSQAKNGTHYIATNQVAGAGAIALRGHLDLVQRSLGSESFDYDEPQFFSVTMDHQLACVNVHWVKAPAKGQQHSFHVEGLAQHLLKDAKGIRAIVRTIKNILEYGADVRLRSLCQALDAYRQIVVRGREGVDDQESREASVKSRCGEGEKDVTASPSTQSSLLVTGELQDQPRGSATADTGTSRTRCHAPLAPAKKDVPPPAAEPRPKRKVHEPEVSDSGAVLQMPRTRSSTRPKPVEVTVVRSEQRSDQGWTFESQGARVFVPDRKWRTAMRGGKMARLNVEYNVWFCE
ncbi:hypothetical protein LTR05_008772 [Lithohypha guttulata]|uniref:DUF7924 domain-containing protein n=1 Tax=Lithohypha guttulata TaxID=1690604 RepID=A0AAN7QPI0_9EURO|nr:hypothetical protein LTR05_008772 [Lithohypha guttulata]